MVRVAPEPDRPRRRLAPAPDLATRTQLARRWVTSSRAGPQPVLGLRVQPGATRPRGAAVRAPRIDDRTERPPVLDGFRADLARVRDRVEISGRARLRAGERVAAVPRAAGRRAVEAGERRVDGAERPLPGHRDVEVGDWGCIDRHRDDEVAGIRGDVGRVHHDGDRARRGYRERRAAAGVRGDLEDRRSRARHRDRAEIRRVGARVGQGGRVRVAGAAGRDEVEARCSRERRSPAGRRRWRRQVPAQVPRRR